MQPEPLIRPATDADIPSITAIYSHHVRTGTATFEIDPPDEEEMRRRWSEITNRRLPYLVADYAGTVAGYAYASPYRPRPAYRFTVEDSVYLNPDFQRRGFGRLLLEHLIADCERHGSRQMIAVIGDSDNAPSIALHSALGFYHAGVLRCVGFKFERWIDTVLMQRSLHQNE